MFTTLPTIMRGGRRFDFQGLVPKIDILGSIYAKIRQNRSFLVFWAIYDVTYLKINTYHCHQLCTMSKDIRSGVRTANYGKTITVIFEKIVFFKLSKFLYLIYSLFALFHKINGLFNYLGNIFGHVHMLNHLFDICSTYSIHFCHFPCLYFHFLHHFRQFFAIFMPFLVTFGTFWRHFVRMRDFIDHFLTLTVFTFMSYY